MVQFLCRFSPWVTMMLWQLVIWALVIGGIFALRHHHHR